MFKRFNVGGLEIILIEPEPPAECEWCGVEAELQPFGPKGERICFECAMKDERTTKKMFHKALGIPDPTVN